MCAMRRIAKQPVRRGTHGDAAVLGEQLGGDAAQGAEHGPPGVDHLDGPVAGEGLRVC